MSNGEGRGYEVFLGSVGLGPGLFGELQAEALINQVCAEGCMKCHGALIREGRYKCYCPKCLFGIKLVPPAGLKE